MLPCGWASMVTEATTEVGGRRVLLGKARYGVALGVACDAVTERDIALYVAPSKAKSEGLWKSMFWVCSPPSLRLSLRTQDGFPIALTEAGQRMQLPLQVAQTSDMSKGRGRVLGFEGEDPRFIGNVDLTGAFEVERSGTYDLEIGVQLFARADGGLLVPVPSLPTVIVPVEFTAPLQKTPVMPSGHIVHILVSILAVLALGCLWRAICRRRRCKDGPRGVHG